MEKPDPEFYSFFSFPIFYIGCLIVMTDHQLSGFKKTKII